MTSADLTFFSLSRHSRRRFIVCLPWLPRDSEDRELRNGQRARTSPSRARLRSVPVRLIVGISLLLLGFGTLSVRVDVLNAQAPETRADFDWVRTADGWERHGSWQDESPPAPPVHPLLVAAGQLLASVLALAAFQAGEPRAVQWKCC